MLARARLAPLRHLDKPERLKLSDCRRYRVTVHAVFYEVLISDGQFPVVIAAVLRQFDLNSIKHAPRGQAQHAVSRAFHHLDKTGIELPVYLVPLSGGHRAPTPAPV
jgi:hypothetical protein